MVGLTACLSLLVACLLSVCGAQRVQSPLNASDAPALRLSAVTSQDEFTVLTHPRFRNHQVRVKKTDFCDPTVK